MSAMGGKLTSVAVHEPARVEHRDHEEDQTTYGEDSPDLPVHLAPRLQRAKGRNGWKAAVPRVASGLS